MDCVDNSRGGGSPLFGGIWVLCTRMMGLKYCRRVGMKMLTWCSESCGLHFKVVVMRLLMSYLILFGGENRLWGFLPT